MNNVATEPRHGAKRLIETTMAGPADDYPQRSVVMNTTCRRRVRYSVRGLLALMVFVAFACFWMTWPKRTAERFVVEYFRELDLNANPYPEGTPEGAAFEKNYEPSNRKLTLVFHNRTMLDILFGRQTFDCEMHEFTICRGNVVSGPTQFWQSVVKSYR